ncbi:hypothetical protein A3J17_03940 [Candidatus Curtissbacteria bacterium RIFCSPLOWO2_02_FULL_40_11]|uniref:Uncharacterized protein n=2 Tax=Candidatus Curtissiibacteriota TaxID=1752717 RepID=A0A1F5G6U8_9BACT|nr:MAG: hypothetical protein A2775_02270 [Candidatus Curtissbacteria bacterium RIFCSPHIGHO2_01_FULL_39_57]OGD87592.1 MAG: hypothetical protein A3D04_04930 [Candidatus Curtissbacteria bacterium RIFCSPHIGHO2_02_FULL_40_16b]OGD89974.1 MAG: hypothetical protein A3E11_02465 [Candidatus Curtissbacteria bacterium RIFCSPHIGHO2_12_FULL_38_37]OGE00678.1 MAG: hypothetical protein A3J17_03940 [Candidatus Curtissbacteria bacterium RIFCSPLOWO2_02_FULL_40_11]OGE13351.1 MAG: hypothetical protein A3G14_01595 [C
MLILTRSPSERNFFTFFNPVSKSCFPINGEKRISFSSISLVFFLASFFFLSSKYLNFLKSIIFTTGGLASGAISTRSCSLSWAFLNASVSGIIPSCLPLSSIRRISDALIC